jgi:SAM-dependent methyltransferase
VPTFWDRVAHLPGLSPVVDYQPEETPWARYITALHEAALARFAPLPPGGSVLDFGCGIGRISRWLAARVARVVAVDTSAEMIAAARLRDLPPNVELAVLPQGDGDGGGDVRFEGLDGAVAIWVLQHILDEDGLDHALGFLARALAPGAPLCTLDRLCREAVDHGESDYLCLRRRSDLVAAIERHGFEVEAVHPISIDEKVLGSDLLTRLAKRGRLPPRALAALDLAFAARRPDAFLADCLCVARRRPGRAARGAA